MNTDDLKEPEPVLTQAVVVKIPDTELNPHKPLDVELRESIEAGHIDRAIELWQMRNYLNGN